MESHEFLWKMCEQNLIYCRFHEDQRIAVSKFVLIVAAGALGLAKLFQGIFVILIGLLGVFVCEKEYERFDHHYERFRKLRKKLIESMSGLEVGEFMSLNYKADAKAGSRYLPVFRRSAKLYWRALHILVSILGVLLITSIFI